ncbi:hypothetical protein ACJX0J_007870, partial [Zea mays]
SQSGFIFKVHTDSNVVDPLVKHIAFLVLASLFFSFLLLYIFAFDLTLRDLSSNVELKKSHVNILIGLVDTNIIIIIVAPINMLKRTIDCAILQSVTA